jgi:hypothetical protein
LPTCGHGDPNKAAMLKDVPLWAFHGENDPTIPVKGSVEMIAALHKLGAAEARLTLYPDIGHPSWLLSNANPDLFTWFLHHRRGSDGRIEAVGELTGDDRAAEAELLFHLGKQFADVKEDHQGRFHLRLAMPNRFTAGDETFTAEWDIPAGSAWTVQPQTTRTVVGPGKEETVEFVATRGPAGRVFPIPLCKMSRRHAGETLICEQAVPMRIEDYLLAHLPTLAVPRIANPPAINGRLDDPAWKAAAHVSDFDGMLLLLKGYIPPVKTDAYLAYDDSFLYVAFRCEEPFMDKIKAAAVKTNDPVYLDDDVEVLIDPTADRKNHCQIAVNSLGTVYSSSRVGQSADFNVRSAAAKDKDGWTVEMAIPWADLKVAPSAGKKMGFVLARSRQPKATGGVGAVGDRLNAREQDFQFPLLNGWNHRQEFYGNLILK